MRVVLGSALALALAALTLYPAQAGNDEEYWTKQRIEHCLQAIEKLKAQGLMSEEHYARKRAMLERRLAGTFVPSVPAREMEGEINFIQNPGFEQINKNTARNRSRWLWWNGWSWGGEYENFWATGENKHSGEYAAGIRCLGRNGRIGIFTPRIPLLPGTEELVFTIWAKGEGDNMLFINFEQGARGSLRQKIPPQWTKIEVRGKPEPGAQSFNVFIYSIGYGTIYLDDAKLVPVGAKLKF